MLSDFIEVRLGASLHGDKDLLFRHAVAEGKELPSSFPSALPGGAAPAGRAGSFHGNGTARVNLWRSLR